MANIPAPMTGSQALSHVVWVFWGGEGGASWCVCVCVLLLFLGGGVWYSCTNNLLRQVKRCHQAEVSKALPCFPAAQPQTLTEHACANTLIRGDLSSLRWIASPLCHYPSTKLCKVYYASLNFRDIMLASGKLPADAIPGELLVAFKTLPPTLWHMNKFCSEISSALH